MQLDTLRKGGIKVSYSMRPTESRSSLTKDQYDLYVYGGAGVQTYNVYSSFTLALGLPKYLKAFSPFAHTDTGPQWQGIFKEQQGDNGNKMLDSLLILIIFVFGSMLQDTGELHIVEIAFFVNGGFSIHLINFLVCKPVAHGSEQFTQVILMNETCIGDIERKEGEDPPPPNLD